MATLTVPKVLSTTRFFEAIHAVAPRVAVFDCDGTLWSGDAGSGFMNWSIERGLVSRAMTDWIRSRYRGYEHGEVSELAICGEMVQMYEGLGEELMREAAHDFFRSRIEQNIFPEMLTLVTQLRERGTEVWAVSSTTNWVIEEGVQRFNIEPDRVLAACVECVDGTVTRVVRDVPTDEGKVAALARVGLERPDAVFGNSVHDAAMLAIAKSPFPVNPTPALAERSGVEGWAVYYPASVAPK